MYSKFKVVSQINTFLSDIWTKLCHTSFNGINIVGEIFSLTIFSLYLNKLNNSTHILSLANIESSTAQRNWNLFLKTFNAFEKKSNGKIQRIEIFISNELNAYLGDFQIPSEIINFKSDKDIIEYDKNATALDIRCGLIPCPSKKPTIDIMAKYKMPNIKPSSISIYTNIPISNKTNEKVINGGMYQLLHQIPIKSFDKNSPSSIQYFPNRIVYKSINKNYKMDLLEILLINPETNRLIDLNNDFILSLDFKYSAW